MSVDDLTLHLKPQEALFLLLSTRLSHEFLESLHWQGHNFGETEMGGLLSKLESLIGEKHSHLVDDILEELINSFLPEVPIRDVAVTDYSYPMYSIDDKLPLINKALEQRSVLKVEYYSMDREEVTTRQIEPYFLEKRYNYYILIAYCRWREDIRLFRVDRIKSVALTEDAFLMPSNFQAEEYSNDEHV
jgi:predicted DNA-binding transcriptional regulator YafY